MKKKHLTVKELPVSERPYEKCEQYGASSLSDADLLAVIIRSGTKQMRAGEVAYSILNHSSAYPGLLALNYLSLEELIKIAGVGKVKAIQLLCVAELSKRISKENRRKKRSLLTPEAVANYYMQDMRCLEFEQVMILMMDSKNRIIKDMIVSKGTINASLVDPREIMIQAFRCNAVYLLLLHNHPSGDPTPSRADILITQRIKEAGDLVGIKLMDHIIIGDNKYISLKERGVI